MFVFVCVSLVSYLITLPYPLVRNDIITGSCTCCAWSWRAGGRKGGTRRKEKRLKKVGGSATHGREKEQET